MAAVNETHAAKHEEAPCNGGEVGRRCQEMNKRRFTCRVEKREDMLRPIREGEKIRGK
jgi:hypothetical protein